VLDKINEWARKQEQPGPPNPKRIKRSKKHPEGGWKDQPGKAMRLRVYPTANQKAILMQMMGTVRWVYNEALCAVRREGLSAFDLKALRARLINNEAIDRMEQERIEKAKSKTESLHDDNNRTKSGEPSVASPSSSSRPSGRGAEVGCLGGP